MAEKVRRGVRMTATARKPRAAWREENLEDEELSEDEREASREEWNLMCRQVEGERQKRRVAEDFAAGRRNGLVLDYNDVAGEHEDEEQESERIGIAAQQRARDAEEAAVAAEVEDAERAEADGRPAVANRPSDERDEDGVPPPGVVTAGEMDKQKKRGGTRKTGSSKRKKDEGNEDHPSRKRRKKEDEDPDRFVKMKLAGEEKMKRIDTTRVVHYHAFDDAWTSAPGVQALLSSSISASSAVTSGSSASAAAPGAGSSTEAPSSAASSTQAADADIRAALRRLWEDDDDED